MNLFPNTNRRLLQAVVMLLVFGCFAVGGLYLYEFKRGNWGYPIVALVFWFPLGIGLWRLKPLARSVAMITTVIASFVLFLGRVNPFALSDDGYSQNWPISLLVIQVMVPIGLLLGALYVLSKHKKEFSS